MFHKYLLSIICVFFVACDLTYVDDRVELYVNSGAEYVASNEELTIGLFIGTNDHHKVQWALSSTEPFSSIDTTQDDINIFIKLQIKEDYFDLQDVPYIFVTLQAQSSGGASDSFTFLVYDSKLDRDIYYTGIWKSDSGSLTFLPDGRCYDSIESQWYSWETSHWGRTYLYDEEGKAATYSYLYRNEEGYILRNYYDQDIEVKYYFQSLEN